MYKYCLIYVFLNSPLSPRKLIPSCYERNKLFLNESDQNFITSAPAFDIAECKVAHAIKVYFVCNDETMTSTSTADQVTVQ
jgi:hypothetical protein